LFPEVHHPLRNGYVSVEELVSVSAIKPYEGFGDVDHTIKELMSL
jgi:hypothetical protein